MKNLTVSASPHITKEGNSTRRIMLDVIIALVPCIVAAIFFFGYHVAINVFVCIVACMAAELLFNLIAKRDFSLPGVKKASVWDLSSVVTGIILALNLPSKAIIRGWNSGAGLNIYKSGVDLSAKGVNPADHIIFSGDTVIMCIVGSIVAIVLVKMLFGGIGKNFANPAATARIFLFICFGLGVVNTLGIGGLDASTGATWLSGNGSTAYQPMFLQMFLGNRGSAAVGETCMIAIILGYLYLSVRKVIDFRLPLIIMLSFALFSFVFDGLISRGLTGVKLLNNVYANLMSGGIAFGAVFMATDYSTSPNTFRGCVVFGVGIALFTSLIRVFAAYPEGTSFAILIMNIFVPLIDKFIYPKPFGSKRKRKIKTKNLETEGGQTA